MIESLKIEDFNDLTVELENCGKINYLVGKNGRGKTRILTAIENRLGSISNVPNKNEVNYIIFNPEVRGIFIKISIGNNGGQSNTPDEMNETLNLLEQPLISKERIKTKTEILHLTGEQNEIYEKQLTYKGKVVSTIAFSQGTNYFHNLFQKIVSEVSKRGQALSSLRGNYVAVIIEDIEKLLHPHAQKILPAILEEKIKTLNLNIEFQFFISTHSPFIVRGALNSPINKIFHVKENSNLKPIDTNTLKNNYGREFDEILNDLGFEMNDLYLSNKLIYVEGPTDILYINYWLQKYIQEEKLENVYKGLDFDFIEYGGALASHLTFEFNTEGDTLDVLEKDKLVNLFNLNRQIFFITDNDNKNAFEKSKNKIKETIEKINNGSIFYREKNITTIEDFLTNESSFSKDKNKVPSAVLNLKAWKKNHLGLDKFKSEVKPLVKSIYEFIKK